MSEPSNIVVLRIDVRNPSTEGLGVVEVPIVRSLSPEAVGTLGPDLVAIGKTLVTPYHRLKPTLDRMATLARAAAAEKRVEDAAQIADDRLVLLNQLARDIQTGEADRLNWDYYLEVGRATPEGLRREIVVRAKEAGLDLVPAEVFGVLVPGNCAKVLADLKQAIGERPTAAI